MNKSYVSFITGMIFFIGLLVVSTIPSAAANGEESNGEKPVIDRSVFRAGDEVVVDGTIKGDLYAAARSIVVNGNIEGDLLGAANSVVINGEVEGNVRTAAQKVSVKGNIGKNGLMFAQDVTLTPDSQLDGELITFSQNLLVNGTVGEHFQGAGQTIEVNGIIDGDVKIYDVDELTVHSGANINGVLDYKSIEKGNIAEGTVQGPIQFEEKVEAQEQEKPWYVPDFGTLFSLISMLLLWLVLRFVFQPAVRTVENNFNQPRLKTFGIGLFVLVATPIVCVLLLFTVFGIPIAIITGLLFAILLYVSKVFVGIWLGHTVMKKLNWNWPVILQELTGLILIFILTHLPYIGWVISFVIIVFFLGSVFSALWLGKKGKTE